MRVRAAYLRVRSHRAVFGFCQHTFPACEHIVALSSFLSFPYCSPLLYLFCLYFFSFSRMCSAQRSACTCTRGEYCVLCVDRKSRSFIRLTASLRSSSPSHLPCLNLIWCIAAHCRARVHYMQITLKEMCEDVEKRSRALRLSSLRSLGRSYITAISLLSIHTFVLKL